MAFLQFENGKKFYLTHPVNVISSQLIPGTNTCVLNNETVQLKHAAITKTSNNLFRLIDMCSNNQTFMKEEAASRYESLEPLVYHLLRDSDLIRFGLVVVEFHNPTAIESSQLTEPMTSSFATAKSKFFVEETQELDSSRGLIDDIPEMPETERLTEALTPRKNRGSASNKGLDVVAERDKANADAKGMCTTKIIRIRNEAPLDSSDEEDSFHSLDHTKAAYEVPASRDGSITPDLDFDRDGSMTPDIMLPETPSQHVDGLKEERKTPETILQSLIETDDSGTDDEREYKVKTNPSIFDPTQPFFTPIVRTRFQQKRQAEIKPKVVSLTDFDYTQDLEDEPSPKKACFALETQPFLPEIPETAAVGAKVVNRILMSSDEDNSVEKPETDGAACKISIEPSTPENQPDSPLVRDPDTPDFFPRLPSDSQLGAFLDLANASQASIDNSGTTAENVSSRNDKTQDKENIWQPPRQEVAGNQKKPRRKIMKYDSDEEDEAGPSTRVKVKTRPKKSCSVLISNGTSELNDLVKNVIDSLNGKIVERVAEADVLVTQGKLKLTAKILASICRRIPIVSTEYLEASLRAGGWLDSKLFILCDIKLEERKNFSLKATIQSPLPKIFENFSVFATSNTNIPRELLTEIIENAGGEFLDSSDQQPTRDNVAVIFSRRDEAECEAICRNHNEILKILDTRFVNNVLNQKL